MVNHLNNADREYFRNLAEEVSQDTGWKVDKETGSTVEVAVGRAVKGSEGVIGELWFQHKATEGRLHVKIPYLGTPVRGMKALLEQPLAPKIDQLDCRFTEALGEAHYRIGGKHRTNYLSPVSDPYTVLEIDVPVDYNREKLGSSLRAAGKASRQVKNLHSKIFDLLEEQ